MKVLLIEDDTMIGENIQIALEGEAILVDWLSNGAAAEQALHQHSYDALLLDLSLPQRDGIDILRDLRARGDALPVILMTPGAILSRSQLEQRLFGWAGEVESNAVEVYIHGLRKKLGQKFILNVRGVGYMIGKTR